MSTDPTTTEPEEEGKEPFQYKPLIANGEDREQRLAGIIEGWVTETPKWIDDKGEAKVDEGYCSLPLNSRW